MFTIASSTTVATTTERGGVRRVREFRRTSSTSSMTMQKQHGRASFVSVTTRAMGGDDESENEEYMFANQSANKGRWTETTQSSLKSLR